MILAARFALCSFISLLAISASAQTTIAGWTFPTAQATTSGTTRNFGSADLGALASGTNASAVHSSPSTFETNTGSGGTGYAASANTWNQNDYFQFTLSTVGFSSIKISFDSAFTMSTGGPASYVLYYSTNGSTYTKLINDVYTISSSYQTFSFDLSSIGGLSNNPTAGFRLVEPNKLNPKGGDTSGTEVSVDNFVVSGISTVPEPATYAAILGGITLVAVVWRRRRPPASPAPENESGGVRRSGE